jgi:hypothetical protein
VTDRIPIREPDQIRHDCARKLGAVKVSDQLKRSSDACLEKTGPRLV